MLGGGTALQAAARRGYLEVVERLLAANVDVNAAAAAGFGKTALQAAVKGGHLGVVERLLAANADVNAAPGYGGQTALQAAAKRGHLKIVEMLLAANADVNAAPGDHCAAGGCRGRSPQRGTAVRLHCKRLPGGATSRLWRS